MHDDPRPMTHRPDKADWLLEGGDGPAARLVRRTGVWLTALLAGSVPALHVWWHYVRGESEPMVRTNTQVPMPEWSPEAFRSGEWLRRLEEHLQENSPVTQELRGLWNELRYRLGLLQTAQVHVGEAGWMYFRRTLHADPRRLDAAADRRRRSLNSLRARCEELDLRLLAVPVPDKVGLYPEHAYPGSSLSEDKAALYPRILAELDAAGIERVDARAALRAAKAVPDSPLLYYPADSHWTAHGAIVVAQATAARIAELGWELPGEAPSFEVVGPVPVLVVPDLVALLGLRTYLEYVPDLGESLVRPGSALVASLQDEKEYVRLWLKDPAGGPNRPYEPRMPQAKVALCGTSFSEERGKWTFAFYLGRVLDHRGVHRGGGPFLGLQETLERIASGESPAEVVIWEFVERSYLEPGWLHPPAF